MRFGFIWGILAGAALVAVLGWALLDLTEPRTPTQSAVVEQPSGRVVAEAASATATAGTAAGEAAAGSSAGAPGGPKQGEAESTDAAAGQPTGVATQAAEGGTAAGEAQGPTLPPEQPEQLAALAPAAPTPPPGGLSAPGRATAPAAEATPRPPADPAVPVFDVVRVDASGQTVIAGRARPEQDVEVLLDGRVVDTVRTDASGLFVAVITADLSGEARQLQLRVSAPEDEPADASQAASGRAAATGGVPQQPEATARQPGSTEAQAGTGSAGSAPKAPLTTSDTSGPAVDMAAAPAAPTPPPALTLPQGGAKQGASPGPTPTEDAAMTSIASPDRPLPGGSVGAAPATDGLRVPSDPANGGTAGGAETSPATPAGNGAAPADVASTGPAQSGTATAGNAGTAGGAATAGGAGEGGDMVVSDAAPSVGSQAPSLPSGAATPDQVRVEMAAAPAPGAPPGRAPAELSGGGAAAPAAPSPAGPSPAVPGAPSPTPEGDGHYLLSAPVLILPAARADDAPALVQPKSDELALLQPGGDAADAASSRVVLHQITYAEAGDVQMRGSARPRHSVRVYGDGQILGTAPVKDGAWQLSLPRDRVEGLSLFRIDEIGPAGQVTSRVEAPFRYTGDRPLVLRDREVVIQKGDNLWRIAEHYYGEGLRYSLIYGANSALIRDPDLIYPDQVFSIPELVEAE